MYLVGHLDHLESSELAAHLALSAVPQNENPIAWRPHGTNARPGTCSGAECVECMQRGPTRSPEQVLPVASAHIDLSVLAPDSVLRADSVLPTKWKHSIDNVPNIRWQTRIERKTESGARTIIFHAALDEVRQA